MNGTCRLPPGVAGRPLAGFPATHYHLVHRRGRLAGPPRELAALIRDAAV